MIDDHRKPGQLAGKPIRVFQVLHVKEQVEWHTMLLQHLQAAQHTGPDNEIIVRFIMRHVPDTNELRVVLELQQLPLACLAREIHPSHHARKPVGLFRHAQHPAILLNIMLRLHKDALAHARGIEVRLEVARQIITANRLKIWVIQPCVIERPAPLPEMLMGINHVARCF